MTIVSVEVRAQYYSVNIDKKTAAAMVSAYGAETVAETYYDLQVQDILKHYNAAELATAGIFASKFLERKALTDLGIWSSRTENYYYRRIHHMVADKIMPKIWTVSKMMLHSPQTALYWGSYLMKACDDTKNLCMQFESVVTNGTLSFSDITFLEVSQQVKDLLNLSTLGGVDFKKVIDDLAKASGNFSKENLKADLDQLYQTGAGLATSGLANIGNALLQKNSFHELFRGKVGSIIDLYDHYNGLFESLDKSVGNTLLGMIGGKDDVAAPFNVSDYNMTSWMTDYLDETAGNYYTQRWYIYRRDRGSESLCDYYPPTDDNSIIKGDHWYRINTTDANFSPNSTQREAILQNSESHAGWSRTRVAQMNASKDGFTYTFSNYLSTYIISKKKKQTKKAYAYEIHVKKSWDNKEEVYEDVFDSFSMDLNTFKGQLNARLSELNDNEEGHTYYIGSDSRNYYQATDAAKLKGVEAVTISVTCSDGVTLGQGTTQYKCKSCGGSLIAHSKECAMKTSLATSDNSLDLSELDRQEAEARSKVSSLQSQISALEAENKTLLNKISNSSVEDAAKYRAQYNKNKDKIASLKSELTTWQKKLDEIEEAKEEASKDNDVATDDYYRIPAIMQDVKTAYSLTWQGVGSWNGHTYTRTAIMPNINGIITFKATLSIVRKPKYFLGIKIHRAILGISWELTSDYTNTSVVDVLTLDASKSDQEKADEVNKRLSEIAQEYPSCKISTEYAKTDPGEEDNTDDAIHLLWSSDRLEVAREIDSRITKIYADLVSLEKMMTYKRSIIDVLKDIAPAIDNEQGKRKTIIEECYDRWRDNAKKRKEGTDEA